MSPRPAQVRLPVEPLFAVSGARHVIGADRHGVARVPSPVTELARRVGREPRQVHRWISEGGVPFSSADEAAVACGFHPANVWGDDWWSACWAQDRIECAPSLTVLSEPLSEPLSRRELVLGYQQVERARERRTHVLTGVLTPL